MPDMLDQCVVDLKGKGKDEASAMAICKSALDMAKELKCEEDFTKVMECAKSVTEKVTMKDTGAKGVEKLPTKDMPNQEVFAAGTWNGTTFSTDDLDKIVDAFNKTKDTWGVPIKLSHDHPSALPAVGWVENLRRVGKKLVGDLVSIPEKLYSIIQAGGFRGKSAEILTNVETKSGSIPLMMKAVALLGIDPKAVEDIGDLSAMYTKQTPNGTVQCYALEEMEDSQMKEAEKEYNELKEKVAALEVQLKDKDAKISEMDEFSRKLKEDKENADITAQVSELVKDGIVSPAHGSVVFSFMKDFKRTPEKRFSISGKDMDVSEAFVSVLRGLKVFLKEDIKTLDTKNEEKTLHEKALEMQKNDGKLSYKEALRKASRT